MTRWLLPSVLALAPAVAAAADPSPAQVEFFETKVRPVLADHCYQCHGPKKQSAGLRLDTAAGVRHGADGVPVVVPGDPAKSKLIQSVTRSGEFPMPPKAALPPEAVAALTDWVKTGAALPADAAVAPVVDPRKHWAFQPVKLPAVPTLPNPQFTTHNPIDNFVLAKLSDKGLSPAPPADRRTLIRRAYFDLIGLPPTAADVEAFETDADPKAWEKVIDKLLASPQYGERWGRYWLDLARYADTKGYVFNEDRNFPFAYTYRDYVVRSFNEDKPYDRFVTEQLAADRLPLGDDKQPLAALGFLTLGRRFLNNPHDIIDDRIDVVTRGLMGLTVSCARCHDHKFDPVPTADYYSLYGVFSATKEPAELSLIGDVKRTPEVVAFEKDVEKREAEYRADVERRHALNLKKLRAADAVTDHIRGVFESRGKGAEQLQAFVRERDLNRFAFEKWRTFLATELKAWSPVYGPLAVLADVPEKEFEAKSAGVIAALEKDAKKPVNPLVLKALTAAKPKTFRAAVEAVAGVLAATPPVGPPTPAQVEVAAALGVLDIPAADADKIQTRADRDALAALKRKLDAFKASSPFAPPRAHVLNDIPPPFPPYVFVRGNQNTHGPTVPRQAPAVVAPNRKPFTDGSGRLELARAITSPDNPLTARVFVNRVWAGHFGNGLVRTPSDFGTRSDPPTHPELLDWLAVQFVREGWSVKKLHKLVMQSATYQQSSNAECGVRNAELRTTVLWFSIPHSELRVPHSVDPENRLLTRQNRRRLDFEALRDSVLSVAGKLDLTAGGKPVDLFKAPFSTRRSVYGLLDRTNFPGTMRAFDVASPDTHSPQRYQTTVPQQALFLLNSAFMTEQAKALAGRAEVTAAKTAKEKVNALYLLALGRKPSAEEAELALAFTADDDPKAAFGRWSQLAQALLLSNEFAFID